MFFERGSESTSVLCACRKLRGFNLWIKVDLVFGVEIEIDLVFGCGPKVIYFYCGHRFTWCCAGGRNRLGFYMPTKNHMVLV